MFKRILVTICAVAALMIVAPKAEAVSIVLDPNGPIEGTNGSYVGWGYTIFNDLNEDIFFYDYDAQILVGSAYAVLNPFGTPFDFPVVAANSFWYVPYTGPGSLGFVELFLFGATESQSVSGVAFAQYVTASGLPGEVVATFQAEIVPEPASLLLLGTGLAAVAFGIRRRRS